MSSVSRINPVDEPANEFEIAREDAHEALAQAMGDVEVARKSLTTKHGRDQSASLRQQETFYLAKQSDVCEADANDRFEFEETPVIPMPAPAELSVLPPPPSNKSAQQERRPSLPPSQLALLPKVLISNATLQDDEFEEHRVWFNEAFASHVEEFPRLKNHFLRMHAGGGTPENPLALDWSNMRLNDFRSVRTQAIKFLENRCEEEKTKLEQAIRRTACFAIYHKEQAPEQYRMHPDIFKSYVDVVWTWHHWLINIHEE